MFRKTLLVLIALLNATQLQAAFPYVIASDARPRAVNGKVVTDAFDDATFQRVPNVTTYGWSFQSIPGDPYFLQDPGFNATSSSGLPGGSFLGFDVTRGMSYFTGGGPVGFGATPAGESLTLVFGAGAVNINQTTGAQPGFLFATVGSNGSVHRHLNATLNPGTEAVPTNGIYLTTIRLTNTGVGQASDALYLLFNNGAAPVNFARALDYVANPIPGDADFSGSVSLDDFPALAANFGIATERFWYDGDFNRDYQVNLDDFTLLAANFGWATTADAARASVPEPTSALLVSCLAGAKLRRRRSSCHV